MVRGTQHKWLFLAPIPSLRSKASGRPAALTDSALDGLQPSAFDQVLN